MKRSSKHFHAPDMTLQVGHEPNIDHAPCRIALAPHFGHVWNS